MKTYTNSKGESLPKVICAVIDSEKKRLGPARSTKKDSNKLWDAFGFHNSNIFSDSNYEKWETIWRCNYDHFYSIFPTCKNSRGQELPEEIQVEIVEERLRQWGKDQAKYIFGFEWIESQKGNGYWIAVNSYDYTNTELPAKSDDTFTQGEIVEVSYNNKTFVPAIYIANYNDWTIAVEKGEDGGEDVVDMFLFVRKIQPLELTLPELLTIAESVKGTKVKLKS